MQNYTKLWSQTRPDWYQTKLNLGNPVSDHNAFG